MKGKFFLALLTVAAVVTVVMFSYRENGVKTYPAYKTSSMRGFRLTHKENDKVKWELMAEEATFPDNTKKVVLDDLTMKIYHDREMALKGGSGVYDIDRRMLVITKPIEINIAGARLTTDSLKWNGYREMLSTDDKISIRDRNVLIEGTGLKADVRKQRVRILQNVRGIFYQ